MAVRRATLADLPQLAPLFEAYRAYYGKPPAPQEAEDFLRERMARGESVVLVALAGDGEATTAPDRIVGFAQLFRGLSSLSLGEVTILNDLFVAPSSRRSGAARRLVEEAIAYARSAGALRIELSTQHTNTRARALYDSLGFVADTEFANLSLSTR